MTGSRLPSAPYLSFLTASWQTAFSACQRRMRQGKSGKSAAINATSSTSAFRSDPLLDSESASDDTPGDAAASAELSHIRYRWYGIHAHTQVATGHSTSAPPPCAPSSQTAPHSLFLYFMFIRRFQVFHLLQLIFPHFRLRHLTHSPICACNSYRSHTHATFHVSAFASSSSSLFYGPCRLG